MSDDPPNHLLLFHALVRQLVNERDEAHDVVTSLLVHMLEPVGRSIMVVKKPSDEPVMLTRDDFRIDSVAM